MDFYAKYFGVFGGGGGGGGGASPLTTKGDLYTYTTLDARLPVGTDGQILSANSATITGLEWIDGGGTPFQEQPSGLINGANVTYTLSFAPNIDASLSVYLDGLILEQGPEYTIAGSTITMAVAPVTGQTLWATYTVLSGGGGSGTVTSVAMSVPSFLSVAGSPITTAGTLAVTLATQSANTVFAGPALGVAAAPTFRALVAADLPTGIYWDLAGNAGTGGTAILGTTDAQPFTIRTNNTNLITFSGTDPALSSSVSQVPADNVGLNQFDWRVYIDPTASTTNASHTASYSQLIYDNGNTGFDSVGGAYLANSAGFTHNGSGNLGFASIYSGAASFNSTGVTNQFKGITSENSIASGATVSDYYGMVTGVNTTSGIVPTSTSISTYGNFTDATIGNAFGINQQLAFFGTTANSQGAFGFNSLLQLNDDTTFAGTSNVFNGGVDLNDDTVTAGFNGFNFYANVRDNANTTGINLSSVAISHTDAAVSTGTNGYNTNMQYSGTSNAAGVNVFNGYVRTFDTAHLDGLTGFNFNPEIEGSSDVDNVTLGAFSAQVRGSATVDNLTGITISPQMSGSATVTNFQGMNVNPQVNGTSTLTNGLTAIQVTPQGTVLLNQVSGVSVDMSQVSLTSAALAAGGQKAGITVNDGALSSGYNYTVPGAAGFFQINYLGGGPIVAAGDPTSAFGFGNNLAHSVTLHDDWNLDGSGLGFVDVGFVGSLAFDAGTTMAQWTGALGGAGNPAGAGTLTTAKMFSAAGILPQGGSLTVTNMYGFEVNPNLFGLVGTNLWGFFEDTAAAQNHMSKLAIGTASKKVTNSDVAFEIGNSKQLIVGTGSTATKNALTAVQGALFYDTTLNQLQSYDGSAWVSSGGYTPPTEIQEVPAGVIDGVNDTYTLSQTPTGNASVKVYLDGLFRRQGTDYTIAGSTITFAVPPATGQTLDANYTY